MASTGFEATSGWKWPEDTPGRFPAASQEETEPQSATQPGNTEHSSQQQQQQQRRQRHWRPRQCRICLETVNPTFHPAMENLPGILQPGPSVTYESPEEGRLLRPCKCKGSSKYVHEGCLQAWRHADPSYGRRNYWQCPTCGFRYRMERMRWGHYISSTVMQILLTILIFFLAIFVMGFVADPVINFYVDPYGTTFGSLFGDTHTHLLDPIDDGPVTWWDHLLKGIASLGLLGFLKVFLSSPWFRIGGGGNRARHTGRDRLEQISWGIVILGILTFLAAVWKGVRAWCRRTLERAGERIMDVQGDDDESDDEDAQPDTGWGNVPGSGAE